MEKTITQYQSIISLCKELFTKKTRDYGTAWRILRTKSLTDQIFIKAQRIRTLEETGQNKVGEGIQDEFIGIINYAVMALIQMQSHDDSDTDWPVEKAVMAYQKEVNTTLDLMMKKNHDYGEAWRDMSQESYADLILVKLLRIRQILNNDGKTLISEGIDANFVDILNYSAFALIQIAEGKH